MNYTSKTSMLAMGRDIVMVTEKNNYHEVVNAFNKLGDLSKRASMEINSNQSSEAWVRNYFDLPTLYRNHKRNGNNFHRLSKRYKNVLSH